MRILATGGAGFIGSALVRMLVRDHGHQVLDVDKLTYAASPEALEEVLEHRHHRLLQTDICDRAAMGRAFAEFDPEAVVHLAAESHVDRSIDGPAAFIETNIVGTFSLLDAALQHWRGLAPERQVAFRFVHVSTDEVYGSLGPEGRFTEETRYDPNSPYSASKAGSDHLVRAWTHTYGLRTVISNCSNNYGPRQNAEKLIPTIVRNALMGRPIPIYGDGKNVRDWLFVEDHVEALAAIADKGAAGEKYNVGGHNEIENIRIATTICGLMDEFAPKAGGSYANQITYVKDRPGHDRRYAIDATRARDEIGWTPRHTFETGLRKTVRWYVDNQDYWRAGAETETRLGLGR